MKNIRYLKVRFNGIDQVNKFVGILHRESHNDKFVLSFPDYKRVPKAEIGTSVIVFTPENAKLLDNGKVMKYVKMNAKYFEEGTFNEEEYKGQEGVAYIKTNLLKKFTPGYIRKVIKHSEKFKGNYKPASPVNSFIYYMYTHNKKTDIDRLAKKIKEKANDENMFYPFLKVESKSLSRNEIKVATAVVEVKEVNETFNGINFDAVNSYGISVSAKKDAANKKIAVLPKV